MWGGEGKAHNAAYMGGVCGPSRALCGDAVGLGRRLGSLFEDPLEEVEGQVWNMHVWNMHAWPHTQLPGGVAAAWRCLPPCTATCTAVRTADRQLQRSDGEPQLPGAEQSDQGFSRSHIRGGDAQHLRGEGA